MRTLFLLFVVAVSCASPRAQAPAQAPSGGTTPNLSQALPFDPDVTVGQLENGLTYYIEKNAEPQARAELRLVVKAGSINESDDQLGLAHVVEHMAFNGTEHFSGTELVDYLESIGLSFGAHLNAYTSFDETVYQLQVPTDDPEMLARGMLVLADWASGIRFDAEEIEKERGVVLEEWRRSRGAGGRVRDQMLPLTFKDSRYKDRLPIGTEDSLLNFTREQLLRFYRDWYRPNLMAVVAVGDFEKARVETMIRESFGALTGPKDAPEREYAAVPSEHDAVLGVFSDPEVPRTSLNLMAKIDDVEGPTVGDYRKSLLEQLVAGVFNERLAEVSRSAESPILGAGTGKQRLTPIKAAYVLGAAVKEGQVGEALFTVITEIRRLKQFGVSAAEFDRARKRQLAGFDTYFNERKKTHSRTHAAELIRVFTTGEGAPGVAHETRIARDLLDSMTATDVNTFAKSWFPGDGRVITVVMPEAPGISLPEVSALQDVVRAANAKNLEARTEQSVDRELIASLPTPGTIVGRVHHEGVDVYEWRLSNGMTLLLKQTDFKADQVLVRARSWGGTSTVDDEVFPSARAAIPIARQSGLGEFDALELSRLLAGKRVSMTPLVADRQEGLSGSSSVEDLETLFQLMHVQFSAPRLDETGLALFLEQQREATRNRLKTPSAWFQDAYRKLMWNDFPRFAPWNELTLSQVDLGTARRFLEQRFQNAADFTVVLVGNFDRAAIEPWIARYLASLPGDPKSRETLKAGSAPRRAQKSGATVVRRGLEPKAQVQYSIHGDFENSRENRYFLGAVTSLLSLRLREELREELGGTYSVRARDTIRELPSADYVVSINFQFDPGRAEELVERMKELVDSTREDAPSSDEVSKLKAQQLRARETAVRTNGFWTEALSVYRQRGEPFDQILDYEALVEKLTSSRLHAEAQRWLRRDATVEVLLLPQELGRRAKP